jgi:hypothetical protein
MAQGVECLPPKCEVLSLNPSTSRKKKTKLKIELPYDPEILLLGIYPKDVKSV